MNAERQAMQRRIDTLDQHATRLHAALTEQEREIARLTAELETVKRERDALLHYLTNTTIAPCDICKHEPASHDINGCKHIREVGIPCFEWSGVKENGGAEDV